MSDGDHSEQVPEASEEQTGGLRRAMEQRVKSLHEAEERIRREQSALQEQAKVVFAEREARLARRERELAKREAALAVSEGIAAGVPAERDKDLEEREHALAAREEALERLQAELDSRSYGSLGGRCPAGRGAGADRERARGAPRGGREGAGRRQ